MSVAFAPAPWPPYLKATSAIGTVLIAAAGATAWRTLPSLGGLAGVPGVVIPLILASVPVLAAWFAVTGYALDGQILCIKRLVSTTRIPLDGLSAATLEPDACKGAIRVFGNGGLYAFTGWYRNSRLGRFRLYGTDLKKSVVLVLPRGAIVVTPEQPHAFIDCITQHMAKTAAQPRAHG